MAGITTFKLVNRAIRYAAAGDYRFFTQHTQAAAAVQAAVLQRILEDNKQSQFGRAHGFTGLKSVRAFQKAVPIREYADYESYLHKLRTPADRVLTAEPVLLLEPTGGTSGGSKLIPYTRTLKREFQHAINTWLYDLYTHVPGLSAGQSYWSISPALTPVVRTGHSIPVGFAGDAEYLGLLGKVIEQAFAVPGRIRHCRHYDNFRYLTGRYLLAAEHLSLVSVWSPTFLLLLLDFSKAHAASLVRDLYDGTCTLPCPEPVRTTAYASGALKQRARCLEKVLQRPVGNNLWTAVWPKLKVISCWLDGESRTYAAEMQAAFPGVYIQGKGLIATEGFISLPLLEAGGAVPAYTSHFLEFLPEGESCPCLVTELEQDKCYQVIITTGGGLYRYNLSDRITVSGYYRGLPVIGFTGRSAVIDMVGEKLDTGHINNVLAAALSGAGITPRFMLFAPEREAHLAWYILFLDPAGPMPGPAALAALSTAIDGGLKSNFHYQYARELGQLAGVEIYPVPGKGREIYYRICLQQGQRLGDIKPLAVSTRTGWKQQWNNTLA